jgi:hypothetical protein
LLVDACCESLVEVCTNSAKGAIYTSQGRSPRCQAQTNHQGLKARTIYRLEVEMVKNKTMWKAFWLQTIASASLFFNFTLRYLDKKVPVEHLSKYGISSLLLWRLMLANLIVGVLALFGAGWTILKYYKSGEE